ncbi:MAG: nucleotidyltransferase family protein [Bacteroidaceae bacterium]|nr:nucleotidyltransferase family protein [Bacteroidaceae bacterium]
MTESEKQLLALLRLALHGEPQEELLGDIDWKAVQALAKVHAVEGIAFAGIERLPRERCPESTLLKAWFGRTEYIRWRAQTQGQSVGQLAALLEGHGIRYVVFKGLAVAAVYPEPLGGLRMPGDIDFYVPDWDFGRAVDVIEREWGVTINRSEVDKHYSFSRDKMPYELHYQMETFGRARHQKYFAKLVDDSLKSGATDIFEADGRPVARLCPELDLLLVMKHWMSHLIGEGVGLRQTTDLAVLILRHKETADVARLREWLAGIGYTKAFEAVVAMAERYFGVRWEAYPLRPADYRNADRLMATILKNGNFGRADYKYKKGRMKRVETMVRCVRHTVRFLNLAPTDLLCMFAKRITISIKAHKK